VRNTLGVLFNPFVSSSGPSIVIDIMVILVKVYIVRHGETTSNKDGAIQGHLDTALNEEGRRQATLLAQRLKSEPIHIAYTSDLRRAKGVRCF
jgi:hypothetical protein